jgi:polyisoprenoid-binding protein YceI
MKNQTFKIAVAQSNIDWTGRKVTGAHNGTIGIKSGELVLQNGKLTGGNFVVDVTSIKILDVTDPATNAQFWGHLASDDFFSLDQYPEATFVITSVAAKENNAYDITGDLTIKGITHEVKFKAVLNSNSDTLTATGRITIDRTWYGIKFRSGNFFTNLGDTLIYNDFDLDVTLTATADHSAQEKEVITQALENYYFKGIYEGDLGLLQKVFYEGALLFGDVKGQPYFKTLSQYFEVVQNRQSPIVSGKPFRGQIVSIDVVNSIAVAELKVKMYDFNYHEFLSFHKINNRWVIVNKMMSDTNV